MLLKTLIEQLGEKQVSGPTDRDVIAVTYDSRKAIPNSLFVAMRGIKTDGHHFIDQAIQRGAAAVILEQDYPVSKRCTRIKVSDTRKALAEISASFYGNPAEKLKLVGITGTNGKTTTSFLIKHILEEAKIPTGLIGTVRYEIGERVIPAARTTPESLDLQEMLAQMVRHNCKASVMEVSSHAIEQKRVWGLKYDLAVLTNLTQDHLDYHGDMENYFSVKRQLFFQLKENSGIAIVNQDDPYGKRVLADPEIPFTRIGVGRSPEAQFRIEKTSVTRKGTLFEFAFEDKIHRVQLPLIGTYNVMNSLMALAVSHGLGVSMKDAIESLSHAPQVPGRLERVEAGQPFSVFVDYAHTDDALKNVLTTLREVSRGKLIVVFGCGGNRDRRKRPLMGKVATQLADVTVVTSDNPRHEEPTQIIHEILAGCERGKNVKVVVDRQEAILTALKQAGANDVVLIAGKGHETYQEFADTVIAFDDRQIAQELLKTL